MHLKLLTIAIYKMLNLNDAKTGGRGNSRIALTSCRKTFTMRLDKDSIQRIKELMARYVLKRYFCIHKTTALSTGTTCRISIPGPNADSAYYLPSHQKQLKKKIKKKIIYNPHRKSYIITVNTAASFNMFYPQCLRHCG